jgi:Family of unknown function (DUF6714)
MDNTDEFENRRAALIAEIEAAFAGVSREDGTTLHEAEAMDDRESEEEQRVARRLDRESRWQDVPEEEIEARCSALSFLDAKGFRYYIPAFMIHGLRHWGEVGNDTLHSSEFHLTQEAGKSLRRSEPASISEKFQFTKAQREAVAHFLRFIIDFNPRHAKEATVRAAEKWERYCAGE